jgi:hypothetical protein
MRLTDLNELTAREYNHVLCNVNSFNETAALSIGSDEDSKGKQRHISRANSPRV